MASIVEQILSEVQTLPLAEKKEVLDFVEFLRRKGAQKGTAKENKRKELLSGQALLEFLKKEGLMSELPDLDIDDEPELEPFPYKGKPLSEIILENRGPK